MGIEIELKLDFSETELARFRRWPVLRKMGKEPVKRACLRAIYLDTENLELAASKSALRIRREYGKWMQTFKTSLASDQYHRRVELNAELPRPELNLEAFSHHAEFEAAKAILSGKALRPIFETRIWRTARLLDYKGSRIELALDHGVILANGQSDQVAEAELELLSGDAAHLMELAKEWEKDFDFHLGGKSKAARGYHLAFPDHA